MASDNLQLEDAYTLSLSKVYAKIKSNSKGLTSKEANERLTLGKNKIITPKPSIWKLYLAPLFDVLIVVYLIMTGIMLSLSFVVDGIAGKVTFWLVLISFNMLLAIFQQFRASKKLDSLQDLSPPMTTVYREGKSYEIKAEEIVVGDVLFLRLGDKVPADARVIESNSLQVNEASLTGESDPVSKYANGSRSLKADTPIAKRKNMVYLGTFIQVGEAKVIVVQTGNNTELGKIASSMSEMQKIEMPLRNKINFLGKGLSTLMVTFLIVNLVFIGVYRTRDGQTLTFEVFANDLTRAITNAMAVMPINIPLLTTVVLITGVLNMAEKKVVIKDLSAVETLGRVSVLCSDKTGTMTTSQMTAKLLFDTDSYYAISNGNPLTNEIRKITEEEVEGFMNENKHPDEEIHEIDSLSTLGLLFTSVILNNKANIKPLKELDGSRQIGWDVTGNPTDASLLILAKTSGLAENYVRFRYKEVKSYPFNSTVKRMSGIFRDEEEDDLMIFVKGASEVILPLCIDYGDEKEHRDFTDKMKSDILEKVNSFANEGYRVISVAYRSIKSLEEIENLDIEKERELAEQNLSYVGFAVIFDPPRPGVRNAVADLDSAGIFPIMITGDSPSTAGTIAKQVGVYDEGELVVSGKDIPNLSDEDFFRVSVFARVSPQDKEVIVSKYQSRGDVIAMAGDGVNDALAITRADAGVAMGRTGTEITKDAADIIITDDSYVSMVKGVEEGRNLFEKIRIMVFFYIAVNLAEAIVYFSTSFIIDFEILNNIQRVYIFAIIHAIPAFAIIFGPEDKEIMQLKPRASADILSKPLIAAIAVYAISLATVILSIYFMAYDGRISLNEFNRGGIFGDIVLRPKGADATEMLYPESYNQAKARTLLLTIIYIAESMIVLSIRRMNVSIKEGMEDANRLVYVMVFTGVIMHFLLMYITPLQLLLAKIGIDLQLVRLSFGDLFLAIFMGLLPIILIELMKIYYRIKEKEF